MAHYKLVQESCYKKYDDLIFDLPSKETDYDTVKREVSSKLKETYNLEVKDSSLSRYADGSSLHLFYTDEHLFQLYIY